MALGIVDGYVVNLSGDEGAGTITANGTPGGSTSPLLILGYETSRDSRNIVHDLIDGGIAVALISPRPRSGDLSLLYESEADAWAALALHAYETTFTLVSTERAGVNMTYVVNGQVRLALDEQTRDAWVVTVPYQEVEV